MLNPETQKPILDTEGREVRSPSEIEADAEFARARLAPMPTPNQIKTPDDIIEDLEVAKNLAARSAVIIRDADKTKRALARVHAIAHGKALRTSTAKSAELREADAYEASIELRGMLDAAEVAFDFARSVARSVESSTSALQTQSKMVAITYGLAGTGRDH
jgi:hypothetical protein